jgi:hypothetical protein
MEKFMKLDKESIKALEKNIEFTRVSIRQNGDITNLDKVIADLKSLINDNQNKADFSELKSDMEFLQEYYKEGSWKDVTRWLSNINSTMRNIYYDYLAKIREHYAKNPNY